MHNLPIQLQILSQHVRKEFGELIFFHHIVKASSSDNYNDDANREKKKKEKKLVVLPKQFHAKLHTKLVPKDCPQTVRPIRRGVVLGNAVHVEVAVMMLDSITPFPGSSFPQQCCGCD
jgi:hypothetical protein